MEANKKNAYSIRDQKNKKNWITDMEKYMTEIIPLLTTEDILACAELVPINALPHPGIDFC